VSTENNNAGGEGGESTSSDKELNFRNIEEARDREKQRADAANKRANDLLAGNITTLAKSAGVDLSKGVGQLLVKEYASTLGDELPSEEHFKAFLDSQGYETGSQRTDQERYMGNLQNQSDEIRRSGEQPKPQEVDDLIREAEKNNNWDVAMRLKLGKQLQG